MKLPPFNQPAMRQAAKTNTKSVLAGELPDRTRRLGEPWVVAAYSDAFAERTGIADPTQMHSIDTVIDAFMELVEPHNWISVNAFLPFTGERRGPMEVIRHTLARHLEVPGSRRNRPALPALHRPAAKGGRQQRRVPDPLGQRGGRHGGARRVLPLGRARGGPEQGRPRGALAKGRHALRLHLIDTDADTLWRLAHAFEDAGTRTAVKRAMGK